MILTENNTFFLVLYIILFNDTYSKISIITLRNCYLICSPPQEFKKYSFYRDNTTLFDLKRSEKIVDYFTIS